MAEQDKPHIATSLAGNDINMPYVQTSFFLFLNFRAKYTNLHKQKPFKQNLFSTNPYPHSTLQDFINDDHSILYVCTNASTFSSTKIHPSSIHKLEFCSVRVLISCLISWGSAESGLYLREAEEEEGEEKTCNAV